MTRLLAILSVSTVAMNAGELLVGAIDQVAFTAKFAVPARASKEADAHALPNAPSSHASS
jgi:hypothetical protein